MVSIRRFAVSRLHLPDGRILYNQVLEFDGTRFLGFYELQDELPQTEWRGGDYYLRDEL